jgi:hypothetical protein
MTLAQELCSRTTDRIVERFGLAERTGADGGPHLPLPGQAPGADGVCRVWEGDTVARVVYVGLAFPPANLDSHMIFAFTPGTSLVPHFTLDSVIAGPNHAFHLDLIPKVDLASQLAYMDHVYAPLTEEFTRGRDLEGLSRADLSPRQLALMSPWMLAYRATAEAFAAISPVVDAYLDHWSKLVEGGVDADIVAGEGVAVAADRDRRNRTALFDPDVDPVWNQIEPLIGAEAGATIRALLRGE